MDRRVRRILEVLDLESHHQTQVSELARRVGLGASRLEHLFKIHTKTTIRDFVRERRLARAAELLANSEERISSISVRIGFIHIANFNHAFKKHFGIAPRAFRDRARDNEVSSLHQEIAKRTKS
jgi:transcriptional regulator GlxA family with amidase domain